MKAFAISLFVAALAACGGPDFHFHAAQDSQVNMRLGPVSPSCSLASASTGVPYDDGSVVTFTHHMSGGECIISTTWHGPLMDYSSFAKEAAGELHGGATVDDTEITRFNLKIEAIRLKDLAGTRETVLNVADTSLKLIDSEVDVGGEKALGAKFDTTVPLSDPDHPTRFVATPTALVAQAEKAWKAHKDLDGDGTAEIRVVEAGLDGFVEAVDPALVIDYQLDLTGNEAGASN